MNIQTRKMELIKTVLDIEDNDLIKKVKDFIDKEQHNVSEGLLSFQKYEYRAVKFFFDDINGNRTAIDKAVSDILSKGYHTNIALDSSYLKKVELIVSFLKIYDVFKTIEENQDLGTLPKEENSSAVTPFLMFKFIPNDTIDKNQIDEAFKKFIDYIAVFEESLKVRYYLYKRNRIDSYTGKVKSRKYDSFYTFLYGIGSFLFTLLFYFLLFLLIESI